MQTGSEEILVAPPPKLWLDLIRLHDRLYSDRNKGKLKQLVIKISIAGFALHLLLIFLARTLPHPPFAIAVAGENYLSAVSTPFSIILFYEVLTLIAALPASTTRGIANQYEIVSLIFMREVFSDLADMSEVGWHYDHFHKCIPLLIDMTAGILMFLLVAVFQHVALQRVKPRSTPARTAGLEKFIAQKKIVAIGLTVLLLIMAAYNFFLMAVQVVRAILSDGKIAAQPNAFFYTDLFNVMIFTDVLVLILSLVVSGQYEMVFRNGAFVLSIVLVRFSLTEDSPYGAPLALVAMIFGILTLIVFNLHSRIRYED